MHTRNTFFGALTLAAFGCNEYDLKSVAEAENAGEIVVPSECPLLEPEVYLPNPTPNCIDEPAIGEFNPTIEWTWNENSIH